MALLSPQNRSFVAASTSFANVFFGRTSGMRQVRRDLELLSETDLPVLLCGESGTGKGFVAELLHRQSPAPGRFLKVDCVIEKSISSLLAEAVDANGEKSSWSQLVREGGTLLLDGIEDLKPDSQATLLLLLKRTRLAASAGVVPVRVVSTCSTDLLAPTERGKFRADLLYHINTVRIELPSLRLRPGDIRDITDYYLDRYTKETFRARPQLSAEALSLLEGYRWPGNIRQLDNLMRSLVNMGSEDVIKREMATEIRPKKAWTIDQLDLSRPVALKEITRTITQDVERQIIVRVLKANGWNRQKAAKWLKISYRSLLYKLNELSLEGEPGAQPVLLRK